MQAPPWYEVDLRLDPSVLGFAAGTPSGDGELSGWLAIACIALYFAYRATERWVGFVLRPQVLTIIWLPVFTACC